MFKGIFNESIQHILDCRIFRELILFYKYVPVYGEVKGRERNLCICFIYTYMQLI